MSRLTQKMKLVALSAVFGLAWAWPGAARADVASDLTAATASDDVVVTLAGETVEVDSITAASLTVNGYGEITVSGDVTVNGNCTLTPDAANTTSIANGYTLKVTANSVSATTLNGAGTIATTDGTTVAGGTFYGKITGGLTATGNFVTQNSGAIDTLVIADGKTVSVGNRLASMSNIRFALDATDSTTYTDDGEGNITAFKGRGENTYTLETGATAAVLNAGDATHFGGKPYIQFSSSKYARGSRVSARSYIAVVHPDAAGGYIAYYSTQDRFGPSSTSWYARCYGNNIDSYLFQNGTSDRTFTADADTIVSLCARITASDNREDHIGTDFVGAVGELIGFTSAISIEDRTSCEMYLMDKWNLAAAANFRPLPATAEITLQAGSTLDLGGYAQTVKSISGSGTVQNGTLTVTDAISLNAGETLTLPNTAVFTLGTVAAKIEDTTAGTVTLCGSLADAVSAYTSGTLTILQTLTDVALGATEASISGVVLADGVSAPTFAANPPFTASYSEGTLTNTRTAQTYVWTPGENSTDWSTLSNWRIGGVTPLALPGSSDTVSFTASAEEGFSGWTVSIDSMPVIGALEVNADTTFSGARIQVVNSSVNGVTGTGKITLGDDAGFYTGSADNQYLTIDNNLNITAGEDHPAKVQGRIKKSSSGGATITLNGNLTGSGYLEMGGTRSSTYLNGDNREFAGTITFPDDSATAGARRLNVQLKDETAASSNATWIVYNYNETIFGTVGRKYCFGALFGEICNTLASSRNTSTIEVGALNTPCSFKYQGIAHSERHDNLVKVGTAQATLNAGSANLKNIMLNGGSLVITAGVTSDNAVATGTTGYEVVSTVNYDTDGETVLSTTYTLQTLTRTWTGEGGDDSWATAANWDLGVPTAANPVVFPAGEYTVEVASGAACASMEVAGNVTFQQPDNNYGSSHLAISLAGDITGAGSVTLKHVGLSNAKGSEIAVAPAVNIVPPAEGADSSDSWTTDGEFHFSGAVNVTGKFIAYNKNKYFGATTVSGTFDARADQTLWGTGASLTVNGWANVGSSPSSSAKWLFLQDGATINLNAGGTLSICRLTSQGNVTVNFNGGTLEEYGAGTYCEQVIGGGGDNSNASITLNVLSGGAIIDTDIATTIAPGMIGVGGLTKKGTGALTLAAAPTFTGAITVESGTVIVPASWDGVLGTKTGVTETTETTKTIGYYDTQVAITLPEAPAGAELVSVKVGDTVITANEEDGKYYVDYGATVTITYTAATGYDYAAGGNVLTLSNVRENTEVASSALPAPYFVLATVGDATYATTDAAGYAAYENEISTVNIVGASTAALPFNGYFAGKTVSFATMATPAQYVWVGSTNPEYAEAWCTWVSADGTTANGIDQTAQGLRVADSANQTGKLKIQSGSYTFTGSALVGPGAAEIEITGGTLHNNGEVHIGRGGDSPRVVVKGGTFSANNWFCVGRAANTDAYLEVDGGTVSTTDNFTIGTCGDSTSKGTVAVKSGSLTAGNILHVGEMDSAELTISGGTVTAGAALRFGDNANSVDGEEAVVNLNGGVLATPAITKGSGTGTYKMNFNGGTLKATGNLTLESGIGYYLGEGGLTIAPNGYTVAISTAIEEMESAAPSSAPLAGPLADPVVAASGSTITVSGSGTVTLDSTLPAGTTLVVENGAAVIVSATAAASITSLDVDDTGSSVTWPSDVAAPALADDTWLVNGSYVEATGYTVTISSFANATLTVTTGDTVREVTAGSEYLVMNGAAFTYTLVPASGYTASADVASGTTISANTAITVTVAQLTATVGNVAVSYGADFATATVTATVTQPGDYTLGGVAATAVSDGNGGYTLTFANVPTGRTAAYDTFTGTIAAASGNGAAVTGATQISETIADSASWFATSASGTEITSTNGAWDENATADNGMIALADAVFTPETRPAGDVVTVEMEAYFGEINTEVVDGTAQAAIKVAEENSANVFQVLTTTGFVTAAGVTPDLETTYSVAITIDYAAGTYTVSVDGTPLTVNDSAAIPLAASATGVSTIEFNGSGRLASMTGTVLEGQLVRDAAGNGYATVVAAVAAAQAGTATAPLTVRTGTTLSTELASAGWTISGTTLAATTATWTDATGDHDYATAANWSTGVVPTSSTAVVFPATDVEGGWLVYLGGDSQAASLAVLGDVTFQRDAAVSDNGNIVVQGNITTGATPSTITLKEANIFGVASTTKTIDANLAIVTGNLSNRYSGLRTGTFVVNGAVSIDGDSFQTTSSSGATFNGAVALTGAGRLETYAVAYNSTLAIGADAVVTCGSQSQTYGENFALSGAGTIYFNTVAPGGTSGSAAKLQGFLQNAEAWTGICEMKGSYTAFVPATYGNASSTVRANGLTIGCFNNNNDTCPVNLDIASGGLTMNGDYSRTWNHTGKLTGTGVFTVNQVGSSGTTLYFKGDTSEFAGGISINASYNTRFVFGDTVDISGPCIVVNAGKSVKAAGTWTAATIQIDGTVDNSGGTLAGTVTGAATGVINYTATPILAPVIGSGYYGTVNLNFNYNGYDIYKYGGENSTIVLGTMSGYLNDGCGETGYTGDIASKVVVDGTVAINNAWTVTSEDWTLAKCVKFADLTVDGSLSLASTQSTWGTAYALYSAAVLQAAGEGTITVGKDFKFKIGAVNFAEAPTVGATCAVPLALADNGAIYNGDGNVVTTSGGAIAVTVAGEARTDGLALYYKAPENGTAGLYFSGASVTADGVTTYYADATAALVALTASTADGAYAEVLDGSTVENNMGASGFAVENGRIYKAVAKIGTAGYTTFAAAVEASSAGDTITLLADCAETAVDTTGKSFVFAENSKAFTGTLTGSGEITVSAAPASTTWSAQRFVADGWTGTFVIDWTTTTSYSNGRPTNSINFNNYGISGSTVKLAQDFTGYMAQSGNTAVEILPNVVVDATLTIGNGYAYNAANWPATVTLNSLSVTQDNTLNFNFTPGDSNSYAHYVIKSLDNSVGAITVTGPRNRVAIESIKTAGTPMANTVVANISVTGAGSALYNASKLAATTNPIAVTTKFEFNNQTIDYGANAVYATINNTPGIYYAVANIGSSYYATYADAVAAYQDGDEIAVIDATAGNVPTGWEFADSNTKLVKQTFTLTVPSAENGTYTVTVGGVDVTSQGVEGVYTFDYGTEATVTYEAAENYRLASGTEVQTFTMTEARTATAPVYEISGFMIRIGNLPTGVSIESVTGATLVETGVYFAAAGSSVTITYANAGAYVLSTTTQTFTPEADVTLGTTGYEYPTATAAVASIDTQYYATLQEALSDATAGDTVTLLADIELSTYARVATAVTLNMAGHSITSPSSYGIVAFADLTITGEGSITARYSAVLVSSAAVTVKNGTFVSTAGNAFAFNTNTSGGSLAIEAGTVQAQEGCVIFGRSTNNSVTISGGTFTSIDNAVLADNGTAGCTGNALTITGGTFNGGIVTAGYVACGIYVANDTTVTVSGGTFNITGGCGILARAGVVNVTGGTFNTTGNTTGKVGDSRIVVPCAAVVFDTAANYPGYDSATALVTLAGGTFVSETEKSVVQVADEEDAEAISIPATSTAQFSDADADGVAAGYELVEVEGSDPVLYEVAALAGIEYYSTWSVANVFYFNDEDPIPARTTQGTVPKIRRTGESSYHAVEDWVTITWKATASDAADASAEASTIASVDENGLVTFAEPGTVKVWLTMTDPSGATKSASKTVKYASAPAYVVSADGQTRTAYATLYAAFNHAETGETIVLGADATVSNIARMTLSDGRALTLDLNGHTVTCSEDAAGTRSIFNIKSGSLAVVDTGATKGGIAATGTGGRVFSMETSANATTALTIGAGVNISSAHEVCVYLQGNATLTTAGNLTAASDFAICGNGSAGNGGTTVNVTGGTVTGGEIAIYQPQDGALNISGGTITGGTAVYVKSGSVTVTGGTLVGTGTLTAYSYNGSGANATGDALVIDNCGYPGGVPDVEISGGTFTSVNAYPVGSYTKDESFDTVIEFISGGTFSDAVLLAYCADGYMPKTTVDPVTGATTYGVVAGTPVAQNFETGVYYTTLASAVSEASAGDTITVLVDEIELTSTIEIDKNLTIDLGASGCDVIANDCRAFWVKAGAFTLTGWGYVSTEVSENTTLADTSSVIRVGSNDAVTSFTLGESVSVTSDYCYGITYFGAKKQTVVIDGYVMVHGTQAALSGNGLAVYNTAEGGSDVTVNGFVWSSETYAIYSPETGTLTINGEVEGLGGIEVKAGTVTIGEDARITSYVEEEEELAHVTSNDGTSTTGYAIAAIGNANYVGAPTVTIAEGATIVGFTIALAEANATAIGTVTATSDALQVPEGYRWEETETEGVYALAEIVMHLDVAALELYPNSTNYVYVVDAPAGSTFAFKFAGDVGSGGYSKTEGWGKPYGKTPGGTGTVTAYVTNNNEQVGMFVCNVTVKDVVAALDGVEYASADWNTAVDAAIESGKVLEVYYNAGTVTLEAGETLRWKAADNRGQGKVVAIAAAATSEAMFKVTSTKDSSTGVTTAVCTNEGAPNVMITKANGDVSYAAKLSPTTANATYKLLRSFAQQGVVGANAAGVTLDLNGQTLTLDSYIYVRKLVGSASLTIKDTSLEGTGAVVTTGSDPLIWVNGENNGDAVVIEGGSFTAAGNAVYTMNGGTATITGGEFRTTGESAAFLLNCQDANKGTITVTGGKFYGFNPANNTADGAETSYLPATGYISVDRTTYFEVIEAVEVVLAPGESRTFDTAAEAALATVGIAQAVETAVGGTGVDAYKAKFEITVTQDANGKYVATCQMTDTAETAVAAEMDGLVSQMTFDGFGVGDGEETFTGATPGLYYYVMASDTVGGTYAEVGERSLAGADGEVTLTFPADGKAARFYKIAADYTAGDVESGDNP